MNWNWTKLTRNNRSLIAWLNRIKWTQKTKASSSSFSSSFCCCLHFGTFVFGFFFRWLTKQHEAEQFIRLARYQPVDVGKTAPLECPRRPRRSQKRHRRHQTGEEPLRFERRPRRVDWAVTEERRRPSQTSRPSRNVSSSYHFHHDLFTNPFDIHQVNSVKRFGFIINYLTFLLDSCY